MIESINAAVVTVGARSRQAYARRKIPIPDRRVFAAARELLTVGTEANGADRVRMLPEGAQVRPFPFQRMLSIFSLVLTCCV